MRIVILGAAGFIGTNLLLDFVKDKNNEIVLVDRDKRYFKTIDSLELNNVQIVESSLSFDSDYEGLLANCDIVYHLISTTVPTTSNQMISEELKANVILSSNLFDACVKQGVKRVVFISSGGTVYGKESMCPIKENTATYPISSYGIQKVTIEKLLYLYNYLYGLDYRVIRLANPYGPYQRPNGILGAVTTFTYKALRGEEIQVYGDGSVVRDYIYIEDAIKGIQQIAFGANNHHTYNLGCGYGVSINELLNVIESTLEIELKVHYCDSRKVDVPVNYLDIERFESDFGKLNPISLADGIRKTAAFMREFYSI